MSNETKWHIYALLELFAHKSNLVFCEIEPDMMSETEDSVHTADADISGEESGTASGNAGKAKKQQSMVEMMRRGEVRKGKRNAPGESLNSPPADTPGAKRRSVRSASTDPVEIKPECMKRIQSMIKETVAEMMTVFDKRFESLQKRIEIVEAENFSKQEEVSKLKNAVAAKEKRIIELEGQVESIDANRRLSCLILSCQDFERRENDENWEVRAAEALNKRIPDLQLDPTELSAAHRLPSDNKVIIKFVRRGVRNKVFDCRFVLAKATRPDRTRVAESHHNGRQLPPLFINECLTPGNRARYDELLRARRPENGGLVTSVFSRNGVVMCRKEVRGQNIRVLCEEDLSKILGGKRFPPPPSWGSGHRRRQPASDRRTAGNRQSQTPSAFRNQAAGEASSRAGRPGAAAAAAGSAQGAAGPAGAVRLRDGSVPKAAA